ncbi:pentatricopeptide repeat-containing protein [Sedimenticola sp.]|uniref:pentatricopeptide repeat-containing protein n=1 Tax=Sedimenticola sp. TaxID=1940285 RepID=UPI003D0DDB17
MARIILVVISLVCTTLVFAKSVQEFEQIMSSLNTVTGTYYLDDKREGFNDRRKELISNIEELEAQIEKDPLNPVLHLLLGFYSRGMAFLRIEIDLNPRRRAGEIARKDARSDPERLKWLELATKSYIKALELDAQGAHPMRLTRQMIYDMTQDVLLDPSVNEAAIRREMALTESPPTETYYWDSYNAMFQSYLAAKRFSDALRILDEMTTRFPDHISEIQTAQANVQLAIDTPEEKQQETKAISVKTEQSKSVETKTAEQKLMQPSDRPEVPRAPAQKAIESAKNPPEIESSTLFLVGMASVVLVFLGLFLLRRRQR